MIPTFARRCEKRASHGDQAIASIGRSLLLFCLVGIGGCASYESLDLNSYDPIHDQEAIANYYRNQAVTMREKAHAQATAAARYEALFGPDADLVSGARSLAHYYEQIAQELERVAQAHADVERHRQRPAAAP
ncbi:MAG: hypothetical protein H8K03_12815 [Nitrospira sp.]|jgi:hypothetical protein|nr:hypothetical protein [Nitrospira sp. BO4]